MSPKIPCDRGQQHAKQETAAWVRRERAEGFISPSHKGHPAIFVNMSQGVGEEIKFIFYHKNTGYTVANPVGRKPGELRGDALYPMKACRCRATSLGVCAWTAREKRGVLSPVCCGSLRCPPRARAAGHLQLFLCGLSGMGNTEQLPSQHFHHQQHRPHPHQALQTEGFCWHKGSTRTK